MGITIEKIADIIKVINEAGGIPTERTRIAIDNIYRQMRADRRKRMIRQIWWEKNNDTDVHR